jgi:transcriptional regulator with XRE-family HTH domain
MSKSISDQLRAAVLASEESRYAIAKATGISQAMLSRFVHGKSGLSMDYIDRLAAHLKLKLVTINSRKRGSKGK